MAVIQLAGELQAPVDPHADGLAQQLLGPHRRTELASLLRGMRDLVKATLTRSGVTSTSFLASSLRIAAAISGFFKFS